MPDTADSTAATVTDHGPDSVRCLRFAGQTDGMSSAQLNRVRRHSGRSVPCSSSVAWSSVLSGGSTLVPPPNWDASRQSAVVLIDVNVEEVAGQQNQRSVHAEPFARASRRPAALAPPGYPAESAALGVADGSPSTRWGGERRRTRTHRPTRPRSVLLTAKRAPEQVQNGFFMTTCHMTRMDCQLPTSDI